MKTVQLLAVVGVLISAVVASIDAQPFTGANQQPHVRMTLLNNHTRINFVVENRNAQPISVLKYGTPLENDLYTNAFAISSNADGSVVPYVGKMATRSWPPSPFSFAEIQPGQSASGSVDLADHYDFPADGEYTVYFTHTASILASVQPIVVKYKRNHDNNVLIENNNNNEARGPTYTNCNANQDTIINNSVRGAITASKASYNCMTGGTCSSASTKWFGTYSAARADYDRGVFSKVSARLSNYAFNAHCNHADCGRDVYAYVYPNDTRFTVYLCSVFWADVGEQVQTIVHEMSHFSSLGASQDYAYGQSACISLAKSNPERASRNADNIAYFSVVA